MLSDSDSDCQRVTLVAHLSQINDPLCLGHSLNGLVNDPVSVRSIQFVPWNAKTYNPQLRCGIIGVIQTWKRERESEKKWYLQMPLNYKNERRVFDEKVVFLSFVMLPPCGNNSSQMKAG